MTQKKKMGRPKKNITKKEFEKLCKILATEAEIADFFECSIDTINNWCKDKSNYGATFSDTYKRLSTDGKMSLRRAMFNKAVIEKNPTMQIWLSKQILGMKERHEHEAGENGFRVIIQDYLPKKANVENAS